MEALEKKEARATARKIRMSAQKARLVIDLIRGKKVDDAEVILINLNKKAARIILKVLNSAVANAVNNDNMEKENLYVKEAFINEGTVMKRHFYDSRSRVGRRDHRTCHINIVVGTKG